MDHTVWSVLYLCYNQQDDLNAWSYSCTVDSELRIYVDKRVASPTSFLSPFLNVCFKICMSICWNKRSTRNKIWFKKSIFESYIVKRSTDHPHNFDSFRKPVQSFLFKQATKELCNEKLPKRTVRFLTVASFIFPLKRCVAVLQSWTNKFNPFFDYFPDIFPTKTFTLGSRGHRTPNTRVRMFDHVRYFLNLDMFDVRMFADIQMFESSNVRMFANIWIFKYPMFECALVFKYSNVRCSNIR